MDSQENFDWYDVTKGAFDVYGFDDGKDGISSRIPREAAEKISKAVLDASIFSSGCRVRFKTNSDKIGLRVKFGDGISEVESGRSAYGFALFAEKDGSEKPVNMFYSTTNGVPAEYEGFAEFDHCTEMINYTLVFPCFVQVLSCEIGLIKDSALMNGKKYVNELPVIFYGSSITHGQGSSNSGNTYEQMISRKYNLDYVNLGFAGNAKGEPEMGDYIASRQMCAFVCDYDHNAPDVEHLMKTYPILYRTIRKAHPNIPYIAVSKPDFYSNRADVRSANKNRRDFIKSFVDEARKKGDENIYFIDGETFFPKKYGLTCTVDLCHPNDLGYSFIANKIGDLVAKVLNII